VQDLEIALHAGKAHLDGKQAEQFVRYRSGYANADLGRLDAQKLFLRAFAQKCKSLSASQFFRVVCASLTGVQTDVGIADAIRVAGVLRQCDADTFPMGTLPGQAIPGKSGAWYYVLNREGVCRMINEYAAPLVPLEVEELDPHGVFDREKYTDFHNIYIAEENSLPLV
jgi:anionic cell wall polymer biosynthesis LytR-Cps2A-Psr (LCP) family protein